jgi:hypothetical protein
MAYRIFSIARGLFYNIEYYYLILEENNYSFERMHVDKSSYLNVWILLYIYIYVNERDSLLLIHYKNSNSL